MQSEPSIRISFPGGSWSMRWIEGGLSNLQLDIVGFLAILGEDSVKRTSRLASLSRLFYLPRLLPAPHSLLCPERPECFDAIEAQVYGISSGNYRNHLIHVTAALFGDLMPRYHVRCIRIEERNPDTASADQYLRSNVLGPVTLVNLFGCTLAIALFVLSWVFGDGMSMIATVLLSLLSTLVGLTNHWSLCLKKSTAPRHAPRGDGVIRWRNGSFLIIKCNEALARQLLFGDDYIDYTMSHFISWSMVGTVALMFSVIALANAKIQLQIAWAAAYVLLNIGHWLAAALPRRLNFDFSDYEVIEEEIPGGGPSNTFTEGLWKAILVSGRTEWVLNEKAPSIPTTEPWREWLHEADSELKKSGNGKEEAGRFDKPRRAWTWRSNLEPDKVSSWDPVEALHRILDNAHRSSLD